MKKSNHHSLFGETSDDADDVVVLVFVAVVAAPECWPPNIRSDGEDADNVTYYQVLIVPETFESLLV